MSSVEQRPPDLHSYLAAFTPAASELETLFSTEMPLTIFDIGSCEGEDTIRYAQQFPAARLFAFEPLPDNLALMRSNFQTFHLQNAEIIPCALSDKVGVAEFHVSSGKPEFLFSGPDWNYGNKSSSLLPPATQEPMLGWINFQRVITVSSNTLARFCAERQIAKIDFVHMDVQGAEFLVLKGAGKLLDRIAAVWLEVSETEQYQGQALRPDIHRLMRAHGFVCSHAVRRQFGQVIEGDDFYVNMRFPRVWRYLVLKFFRRVVTALRIRVDAAIKHLRSVKS